MCSFTCNYEQQLLLPSPAAPHACGLLPACLLRAVQYGYAYRKRTMLWSSRPLPASFEARLCSGYPACACTYISPETGKVAHIINMCTDEVSSSQQQRQQHSSSPAHHQLHSLLVCGWLP
jgi:hypothetical protein